MRNPRHARECGGVRAILVLLWVSLGGGDAHAVQAEAPGDPRAALFDQAPGSTSTAPLGDVPGRQGMIGTGPGPGFPRVPAGITRPPEPFRPPARGRPVPTPSESLDRALRLYGPLSLSPEPEAATAADSGQWTLDAAIKRLLAVNLDLRAKALEISKADAEILTAGLWANPVLFADAQLVPYGDFENTGGGPTQYDINITHPIDINGKWKRRTETATWAKAVVEAQYQDAIRIEIDNLYTAWVDALALRSLASLRAFAARSCACGPVW